MRILIDGQTFSTAEVNRGIGVYLLNILHDLIELNSEHEIFVGVFDDYDKASIGPISNNIKIISFGEKLDINKNSSEEYDSDIIEIIKKYAIDIFWIPNPVMPNVHLIKTKPSCKIVITFYDLIPLIFEDIYLKNWSRIVYQEYISRLIRIGKISDIIITISESSKKDLVEILEIDPLKLKTIYLGIKKNIIEHNDMKKYDTKEYLFYVGGFDPRKNMENAVLAFKKLIEKYNYTNLDFIITCSYDENTKNNFSNFLKKVGVHKRVKLTGYISDIELAGLYKNAKVFFFPSLYEGFGLPILEAMATGIPIAASNNSSIPEIIGDAGLLFDPRNIDDMVKKLNMILSNEKFADILRNKGINRVSKFSWKQSAKMLLDIFESLCYVHLNESHPNNGPSTKIAYFSPISPQKSGISIYSEELLPYLKKYTDIHLFLDDNIIPDNQFIKEKIQYFSYKDFDTLLEKERYDAIIYNMGNNVVHKYIYKTLLKHRCITILHDYVLHPFVQHITALNGDKDAYIEEMRYAYGEEGEKIAKDYVKGGYYPIDFMKFPLNERIIESSKDIIVHNYYAKNLLKKYNNVKIIPHGRHVVELDEQLILRYKRELNLNRYQPILGCFGFLNPNKRINILLDVVCSLICEFPHTILLLVGDIQKDYKEDIKRYLKKYNLSNNVSITGYNSEELYKKYLACTDIVINLRFPTMGETSGTLLDAMAFGKPVIVSNIGSYKEFPDSCCWKVDVDNSEKGLLFAYLRELINNKKLREKMGKNAIEYVENNHNWDKIALKYLEIIDV